MLTTIEAHQLDTTVAYCPTCTQWTATHLRVALVASDSLHVLTRITHLACEVCGWEETYRT